MAIVWSILFGGIYWLIKRNKKYAFVLGLCVLSHWFLDLVVHLPDLPLYPSAGSPKLGLQLWRSTTIASMLELSIFVVGLIFYLTATKAKNKAGAIVFWILVSLLILAHVANLLSPPPASVTVVAWGAEFMWVFVLLAFWADSNRTSRFV